MGESQRSRLKSRLRVIAPAELVERSRQRASVTRYAGHSSSVVRLRAELVDTSGAARRLGLVEDQAVDGYLGAAAVAATVAKHGLIRDETGRFTLRATGFDLTIVADLVDRSDVLAALDLAESLDVRERRAGLDGIERALGVFRG